MLIDPSREDPIDHIEWLPLNPDDDPNDLPWRPQHKTPRGKVVISMFKLDGGLVDHVGSHIRCHIWPAVQRLRKYMAANDREGVLTERKQLQRSLFSEYQPYHAASHGALSFWAPTEIRDRWGLTLPRPGRRAEPHVSRESADPPKLAQMPERVRLEVRADKINTDALVLMLCSLDQWTELELMQVLERAPGTIATARRTLVAANRLRSTPAGYVAIS